jgi:hypothetical protein
MDLAIHTQGLRREFGSFVAVMIRRQVGVVPDNLAVVAQGR